MPANPVAKLSLDSPFVHQLEEGFPWLRFDPKLEPGFREAHLERTLPFIRTALYAALAVMLPFLVVGLASGRPTNDLLANLVRFSYLSPALVAAIVASHLPAQRGTFRTLVAVVALAVGLGYVALTLTSPEQTLQAGFAGLPVVIAFIFFALGILMQSALLIVLAVTVAYALGAWFVGLPLDQVVHDLGILLAANFVCGIGSYMLEHAMRSVYLEGRILSEMVERDVLTGLYNRRAFDRHLSQVWKVARREQKPIAVMMADLDHFKAYNDMHGHQAGDECLRRVASQVSRAARRPLDFAGRYGGEEFILVFYGVDASVAPKLAEDLRRNVASLSIPHRASATAPFVTVSIGVAVVEPWQTSHSIAGVIQLADQALYNCKKRGRNRIMAEEIAEAHISTGIFKTL